MKLKSKFIEYFEEKQISNIGGRSEFSIFPGMKDEFEQQRISETFGHVQESMTLLFCVKRLSRRKFDTFRMQAYLDRRTLDRDEMREDP
jgi:hypothetical protein